MSCIWVENKENGNVVKRKKARGEDRIFILLSSNFCWKEDLFYDDLFYECKYKKNSCFYNTSLWIFSIYMYDLFEDCAYIKRMKEMITTILYNNCLHSVIIFNPIDVVAKKWKFTYYFGENLERSKKMCGEALGCLYIIEIIKKLKEIGRESIMKESRTRRCILKNELFVY